jgi:hypothetical protein
LFGGAGFTGPTSGGGGLFGTSTTGGSQLGGAPASGLFSNSSGGVFSNTSAPTSTGFHARNMARRNTLFDCSDALSTGGGGLFGSSPGGAQPAAVTQYKVIVAGDGGTGKTAWLAKLVRPTTTTTTTPSILPPPRPKAH